MNKLLPRLLLSAALWLAWLPLVVPAVRAQQAGRAGTARAATSDGDHKSHSHPANTATRALPTEAKLVLPDISVLDQDGRKLKFYSDLVKGKLVVINFIYTSCQAVCPMAGRNFAQLQQALGEQFGRDVFLISVSTDPAIDTPARLKSWARAFGARTEGGGWTLVTGEPEQMTALLKVLTGDGARTGYHVPAVYLRRDAPDVRAAWAYGLASPQQLMKTLERLRAPTATLPPAAATAPHSHE